MRIDAYNQVAAMYKASKPAKTQSTYGVSQARDEVQISSFGRDFQVAKQAVAETSDIREEKVSKLKASVQSGNYKVDSGDFANKLYEIYNAKQF